MKSFIKSIVLVFSVTVIVGCGESLTPQDSCNFVTNSEQQRVSWNNKTVTFRFNSTVPEDYRQAIFEAAQVWNNAIGGKKRILFANEYAEAGEPTVIFDARDTSQDNHSDPSRKNFEETDSQNIIYFLDEWVSDDSTEQAKAFIFHQSAQILESDIIVNNMAGPSEFGIHAFSAGDNNGEIERGRTDIQSLFIHEFGHVLGLDHAFVSGSVSVMAEALSRGEAGRRELKDFDLNSLSCEY